MSFARND